MPVIPTISPRIGVGALDLPRVPAQGFGYGVAQAIGGLAETVMQIQDGADKAEAAMISSATKEQLDGTLKELSLTVTDPQEFAAQAKTRRQEIIDSALASTQNNRVKGMVGSVLNPELAKYDLQSRYAVLQKTHDKALGDYDTTEEQMRRDAIGSPLGKQVDIANDYGKITAAMEHSGYLTHEQASKRIIQFDKSVQAGSMNLLAANNPEQFIDKQAHGDYAQNDAVDVQRALDIAGRVADQRARRDEQKTKDLSNAAMRGYEQLAGERKMNIPEMENVARFFGWDQKQIDGLINTQIGLKIANPYEKQLIEHAMLPADRNADYSAADIREAEANLKNLTKDKSVSGDTGDYRSAMQRLQKMLENKRIQGDISQGRQERNVRQSESDARRDIDDIARQYWPGPRSDGQTAEIAGLKRKLDGLDPPQRRQLVDQFEKKLKDQFDKNNEPQDHIQGLRGKLGEKK